MKTVLTIAGSDSFGGAGIQADLKTMQANGVYGMSVVTALTAQNTMGVSAVFEVTPEFLEQQLDAVLYDVLPDAVKIGMIPNAELVEVIAGKLKQYKCRNIVLDPVMSATSGKKLSSKQSVEALKASLFHLVTVMTPNIPEAGSLAQMEIVTKEDMEKAAKVIGDTYGRAVLVKGGHSKEGADDVLYMQGTYQWYIGDKIDNPNTHGTGCTLSSAIASNLAKGYDLPTSIRMAKAYMVQVLGAMLDLGKGSGPLNHGVAIHTTDFGL